METFEKYYKKEDGLAKYNLTYCDLISANYYKVG